VPSTWGNGASFGINNMADASGALVLRMPLTLYYQITQPTDFSLFVVRAKGNQIKTLAISQVTVTP
jgi:hypothetical protein